RTADAEVCAKGGVGETRETMKRVLHNHYTTRRERQSTFRTVPLGSRHLPATVPAPGSAGGCSLGFGGGQGDNASLSPGRLTPNQEAIPSPGIPAMRKSFLCVNGHQGEAPAGATAPSGVCPHCGAPATALTATLAAGVAVTPVRVAPEPDQPSA